MNLTNIILNERMQTQKKLEKQAKLTFGVVSQDSGYLCGWNILMTDEYPRSVSRLCLFLRFMFCYVFTCSLFDNSLTCTFVIVFFCMYILIVNKHYVHTYIVI